MCLRVCECVYIYVCLRVCECVYIYVCVNESGLWEHIWKDLSKIIFAINQTILVCFFLLFNSWTSTFNFAFWLDFMWRTYIFLLFINIVLFLIVCKTDYMCMEVLISWCKVKQKQNKPKTNNKYKKYNHKAKALELELGATTTTTTTKLKTIARLLSLGTSFPWKKLPLVGYF